ncbi:hypothetical protein [Paenibacillus nasutitermitis]|uniref:Uncharacterized protein n=1 Tax=Paenibacillus nasutitermitis TaxID=1652958 RepID=A0A916ZCI5_9BACL|nr:hypothetical protein [Paenibacillus nasutitermitis]GGD88661.1 hypothetical protein GCM10010911_54050 [Paenibacillus nasutitermitis]
MKLNHLNLTVTDVPAARRFLEIYFNMVCAGSRKDNFAAMFDDDDYVKAPGGFTVEVLC